MLAVGVGVHERSRSSSQTDAGERASVSAMAACDREELMQGVLEWSSIHEVKKKAPDHRDRCYNKPSWSL